MRWRRSGSRRRMPALSFVLILAGAALTSLTGRRGYVHLQPGEPVNHYVDREHHGLEPLPFTVQLDSFRIRLHRSTLTPSDYVSYLRIDGQPVRVSMNRVLERQQYRFYQSSYDEDGSSWLSVNRDPWGIALTYMGYAWWGVSAVGLLLAFRSRQRRGEIPHFVTNDETVGADLCVCLETSTSAFGRTRRSAPTALSSNRFTLRTAWAEAGTVAAGAVLIVLSSWWAMRCWPCCLRAAWPGCSCRVVGRS